MAAAFPLRYNGVNLKIKLAITLKLIKPYLYFHVYRFHSPILSGSDNLVPYPVKLDSF